MKMDSLNSSPVSNESMDMEEEVHGGQQAQLFVCKICKKLFDNVNRLQRHMLCHDMSPELRKFKCDYCTKAFKFKHHLKVNDQLYFLSILTNDNLSIYTCIIIYIYFFYFYFNY